MRRPFLFILDLVALEGLVWLMVVPQGGKEALACIIILYYYYIPLGARQEKG